MCWIELYGFVVVIIFLIFWGIMSYIVEIGDDDDINFVDYVCIGWFDV